MGAGTGRGHSCAVSAAHVAMAIVLVVAAIPAAVRGQSAAWPCSFPCKYTDGAYAVVLSSGGMSAMRPFVLAR